MYKLTDNSMRFRVESFIHRDYSALLERSQMWATVWGMGHVFMVLSFAMAMVMPLGAWIIGMSAPDVIEGRAWDLIASFTSALLLISAIGFAVRSYAKKKGNSLSKL